MTVRWSPLAIERVIEISGWIAADRPGTADGIVDGLFSAVDRLAEFPNSGRQVPECDRADLREIIFKQFRIVYRVGPEHVDILTVRHSLQLMDDAGLDDQRMGGLT